MINFGHETLGNFSQMKHECIIFLFCFVFTDEEGGLDWNEAEASTGTQQHMQNYT